MTNIIKQIREIIGKHWTSQIKIHIFEENEIVFYIYETEAAIMINLKNKDVYLDCEFSKHHLTGDMLDELGKVVKILEENLDVLEDLMK